MDDRDRAIKDLGNAIEADPYRAEAYFIRGSLYYTKNEKKDELEYVIQDLNKAIQLQPNPKVCNLRAWTWLRLEEWEKAKSDLDAMQSVDYEFIRMFEANYKSVEDFEQRYDVQLPEDIKAILTQPL